GPLRSRGPKLSLGGLLKLVAPLVRTVHLMARTRALVVEDEPDIAGLIKHALERGGDMEVEIADAGDIALKAATDAPPDLVILDLNLPVVNGFEVCRILR